MNLVVIYAPPASGKLTVAKALEKITGYKIFHNHLTYDLLAPFMETWTDHFWKTNDKLRIAAFEAFAKEGVEGVIFTYCYAEKDDRSFANLLKKKMEKAGAALYFVQLVCNEKELFKRVRRPSREKFGKASTVKRLKEILTQQDFSIPIRYKNSISIENTRLSAARTAQRIVEEFGF